MLPPIQKNYYVFREAQNVLELKALLELRYRGYLESRCSSLIKQNPSGLDLDAYDLRSKHMGFFQLQGKKSKPLGYMRLVEDDLTASAPWIWQLALAHPELCKRLEEKPVTPFPLMDNCPKTGELMEFYQQAKANGERMLEGSRFVFDKDVRSRGFPKFMLESSLAVTLFSLNYKYAFLACNPRHGSFYSKYFCFQPYKGLEQFEYDGLPGCVLINTKKALSESLKEKLIKMAAIYQQTGMLCHFPENQNQFKVPQQEQTSLKLQRVLQEAA